MSAPLPSERRKHLDSYWTIFHEIWYLRIFRKSVTVQLLCSAVTKHYGTVTVFRSYQALWHSYCVPQLPSIMVQFLLQSEEGSSIRLFVPFKFLVEPPNCLSDRHRRTKLAQKEASSYSESQSLS